MRRFQPVDDKVRDDIVRNLDESLCVEAGAGTGKTTVLVDRIVEILRRGRATVDDLVVMTFTENGAAELAARVRDGLERALVDATDTGDRERLHAHFKGSTERTSKRSTRLSAAFCTSGRSRRGLIRNSTCWTASAASSASPTSTTG